jgi:hypothetical protein
LMCIEYIGHRIKKVWKYALFIIPFITIFMHYTNDTHHFYYKSMGLRGDSPFPNWWAALGFTFTPCFFFYV